jgi:hypothetical protein
MLPNVPRTVLIADAAGHRMTSLNSCGMLVNQVDVAIKRFPGRSPGIQIARRAASAQSST